MSSADERQRTMPENTAAIATGAPRAGEPDYFALQQEALRELLELSGEVVTPRETALAERLRSECASAEAVREDARERIEAHYQEKCSAARRENADAVRDAEAQSADMLNLVEEGVKQSRGRLAGQAREIEKQALREREDNLLMAETVYQSTLDGLRKDFENFTRDLEQRRRSIAALVQQASERLGELRYAQPSDAAGAASPAPAVAGAAAAPNGEDEASAPAEPAATPEFADPAEAFGRHRTAAQHRLAGLYGIKPPALIVGAAPFSLLLLLNATPVAVLAVLRLRGVAGAPPLIPWAPVMLAVTLAGSLLLGRIFKRRAWQRVHLSVRAAHEPFQTAIATARRALDRHLEIATDQLQRDEVRTTARRAQEVRTAREEFDNRISGTKQRMAESLQKLELASGQQRAEIEQTRARAVRQAQEKLDERQQRYKDHFDRDLAAAQSRYDAETRVSRESHATERAALEQRWQQGIEQIWRLLGEVDKLNALPQIDWDVESPEHWTPPKRFTAQVRFGHWRVDLTQLAASVRAAAPFLQDGPGQVDVPAVMAIPQHASLLLQTGRTGRQEAIDTLRAVMLRLLTSLPPGRVQFTILDPVGLGENFAGFMHLVDFEEKLVGGRIWTESEHIEARLTELTNHLENVIQKYLRNEFATIDEYNAQAGELAEPYRFLVIADFPANFNDAAARRLNSIVNSGARCGVFTLIAHDQRLPIPNEIHIEDLAAESVHLVHEGDRFVCQNEVLRRFPLTLDTPPSEETLTRILQIVGHHAKDSLRVEVPFEAITPPEDRLWSEDAAREVRVALGFTGAVRRQQLRLGRGIAQHALIAGKTGSGKSTLLHVMVTNMAMWYSPEELEFYLVDFKKGVEFKTYVTNHLPHARAIAIESDREFGVSVLQRLDAEMDRRGDLFRSAGVQDLAGYRETSGRRMPRTLLIVDEFQVFFSEDDRLAQEAARLLDRLVRQGRAFGLHVLLGSQTLGGSASLGRSTIGQMAIRIALQCSEADSQLILDDTNVAARLLSRPGEAIYNDAGGLVEGNSPFQTAWLSDDRRNAFLEQVAGLARQRGWTAAPPIVFEGNAPAQIQQNRPLSRLLEAPQWPAPPAAPRAWLGEPVAIKEPTNAAFPRQSGANLMLVGQREDAAAAMLSAALLSLAAQQAPPTVRFVVLDVPAEQGLAGQDERGPAAVPVDAGSEVSFAGAADGSHSSALRTVAALLPHPVKFVEWRDVPAAIAEIADEVQRRLAGEEPNTARVFLLINGLQRYRMLRRREDDFGFSTSEEEKPPAPDKQFADILRDGPPLGVHTLLWADALATLERTLDRASLGEFDSRVLFQMSAADSAHLIDSPEANRLGLYRALLHNEAQGVMEKFRPYAALDGAWLRAAGEQLVPRK